MGSEGLSLTPQISTGSLLDLNSKLTSAGCAEVFILTQQVALSVVVGPLNSSIIRANLYICVISYKMLLTISTKHAVNLHPPSTSKAICLAVISVVWQLLIHIDYMGRTNAKNCDCRPCVKHGAN